MIAIQNLRLCRGKKELISSLTTQLEAGQVVAVLGPNGAGKSTLLQAVMVMFKPEHGLVSLNDASVAAYSKQDLSRLIAWQGDLPPAEFGLTVGQRLNLAMEVAHSEPQVMQQRFQSALAYLELESLQTRSLAELSSGERQRVEIAAIMVRDNPIWLMDEPTAHLDLRHQADCLKLMKKEAQNGRLILTVLHDLQQAAAVADIVILLDGKGGVEVGEAATMLTAQRLEPVFGVKLKGIGRDLMPIYSGEIDEEA